MKTRSEPLRQALPFSRRSLDSRAVDIISRLQEARHEAYFVGGCVRDWLLDRQPKDFDLATSASPNMVRRLFRRSRVIGRRFKLVHVYSGREVYEVATFRSAPAEASGDQVQIIRNDNTFGTAQEDALRRDFTVNALFLDPIRAEIVDYSGGLEDIRHRRLRSIGDPRVRFREDPVRILRLVKFMRRLDLNPGSAEVDAAQEFAHHLSEAAPPRVIEEVFRLMQTGDMAGVLEDLQGLGVTPLILPELAEWLDRGENRESLLFTRLAVMDDWIRDGGEPSYAFLLASLFGPLVEEEFDPSLRRLGVKDASQIPGTLFRQLQQRARLPRWVLSRASKILSAQVRMDPTLDFRRRRRRKLEWEHMVQQDFFPEALEYLRCRLEAAEQDLDLYDEWHERALFSNADQG